MPALIAVVMLLQSLAVHGTLTWLEPGNYDTTVLEVQQTTYEIEFGPGCDGFGPEQDVLIVAGSGGVASLFDADGNGQCNVLIGVPVGE